MKALSRRVLLVGGSALLLTGAVAGCTPQPRQQRRLRAWRGSPTGAGFVSGASCIGVSNGQFAGWRRKRTAVAATWASDGGLQQLRNEYAGWTGSIDYAPQYRLDGDGGFTWAAMARGRYDARIRKDLRALVAEWGDRASVLNYRFQHEFNGDWYPWSITDSTVKDYVSGWRRFAALFQEETAADPRFRIVWSPNGGTPSKGLRDVRSAWPGDDVVDTVGVDYYDFFPLASMADWRKQVDSTDGGGGPVGIGAWRRFAEDRGTSISVPEWGNQYGDNPLLIEVMHELFARYAAPGPEQTAGRFVYEAYFNQRLGNGTPSTEGDFRVMADRADSPLRPRAARRYRELWGAWDLI